MLACADLCAVGRPHLADPAWTLHETAKLQSQAIHWPEPYLSGRDQMYRELARQKAIADAADKELNDFKAEARRVVS